MTLNLAEMSVAKSRPSVPRVANLCSIDCKLFFWIYHRIKLLKLIYCLVFLKSEEIINCGSPERQH